MNKIPQNEWKNLIKEVFTKMCKYTTDEIRQQLSSLFSNYEVPNEYNDILNKYSKNYNISKLSFVFNETPLCENSENTPDKVVYQLVFKHAFPHTRVNLDLTEFGWDITFNEVYSEILRQWYKAWWINKDVVEEIIKKELSDNKSNIHKDILYLKSQENWIKILWYIWQNINFIQFVNLLQDKNSPVNKLVELSKLPNWLKLIEKLWANEKFFMCLKTHYNRLKKIANYENINWLDNISEEELDEIIMNWNINDKNFENVLARLNNLPNLGKEIDF